MSIEAKIENKIQDDLNIAKDLERDELQKYHESCDKCSLSFLCIGLNKFKSATNFFNERLIDTDKAIELNSALKTLLGGLCNRRIQSDNNQTTILDFK